MIVATQRNNMVTGIPNRRSDLGTLANVPRRNLCSYTAWTCFFLFASVGNAANADSGDPSFFEDFSTFDATRWYISDGWSNGDHQNCLWSESAVVPEKGRLSLYFFYDVTESHDYRCAEIQSMGRFGYGAYEARFRTDEGSGLNSAFFTYIGEVHGESHDEIDFEILTANPLEVTVNTFVDGEPMHGAEGPLPRPSNEYFHVYSFIWEPERIRWYVDGSLIHSVEDETLPSINQKIYFSVWGSDTLSDWMGTFDHPTRPVRMDIDWVAFTALGEDCQFDESVLCALSED